MKRTVIAVFSFLILTGVCQTGLAQKVRLRGQITPTCGSGSQKFADIYGEGNIAVMGTFSCRGAFIFNIANPDAPTLAAHYNPGNNQQFLEAIVLNGIGYFGSGNGGGVHIVNLANPSSPQVLGIVNASNGNGFSSIHEMVVFTQGAATYLIENFNGTSNRTMKIINVTNPAAAVFIRDFIPTEVQWVHAMMVKGNRMVTSGWGNSLTAGRTEIYDISNIGTTAPTLQGFIADPNGPSAGNNNHSAWLSEDGNYLYSAREISGSAANGPNAGDVRVFNITDPLNPLLTNRVTMVGLNLNAVTPHNPVVAGNKLYVSWYQAGLQVFDISTANSPVRIGQYDTFQNAFAPEELVRTEFDGEPWDVFCGRDGFANAVPTGYDGAWAVFPFLGEDKVLIGDLAKGLFIVDVSHATEPSKNVVSDFDGDGRTDLSVFTSASGDWTVEKSSDSSQSVVNWGQAGDIITPGDYDGDGKTDHSIFRPSTGVWWFVMSSNGSRPAAQWGLNGDVPVPADYDADGKTDIAVWRPSNGVWYINQSTLGIRYQQWGVLGDKVFTGDYEGDGKADLAVWRPTNGVWYVLQSSSSIPMYYTFGTNGDKPLFTDFDGDGRSDFAVYRPSNGVWYWINSSNNSFTGYQFGLAEDMPIPADYDGDGKSDITVFRPSTNFWYRLNSGSGSFTIRQYGQTGDRPSPSSVQAQ